MHQSHIDHILGDIGRRIREGRLAAELSQEAAAAKAGIDYKRWQRLEQGSVNATVRTLVRVAEALGISFWELLSPADGKKPAGRSRRRSAT